MREVLLVVCLTLSLYADESKLTQSSDDIPWGTLIEMAKDVNSSELYKMGSEYIDEINTQENRDKAVAFYERSKEKISSFSVESIKNIACSAENNQSKQDRCDYWKKQESLSLEADASANRFCDENSASFQSVKSTDIKMQELEALFLGLCQKVKLEELTSSQAQEILNSNQKRLH
ncbi:MAG: hypothetical protein U9N39_09310 [Campylobacterota bacterium]|nr:hypothetical protein [Campylobacterota bacterium]